MSGGVPHGGLHIDTLNINGVGSDVSPGAAKRFGQMVLDEVTKGVRQEGARIGLHPTVNP